MLLINSNSPKYMGKNGKNKVDRAQSNNDSKVKIDFRSMKQWKMQIPGNDTYAH